MEALYFPRISLPSPSWTYPNILFFDKINVIAPNFRLHRNFNFETRILCENGLVNTIDPSEYLDEDDVSDILDYIVNVGPFRSENEGFSRINTFKFRGRYLLSGFIYKKLLIETNDSDGQWVEGPTWIIEELITAMAAKILSAKDNMPIITDRTSSLNLISQNINSDNKYSITQNKRRMDSIIKLLPVSPHINIDSLVEFKNAHHNELKNLQEFVVDLTRIENSDEIFERDLSEAERLRDHLIDEINEIQRFPSEIEISLSAASVGAAIYDGGNASIAASALSLSYLLYNWMNKQKQKKLIEKDKLVFAARAEIKFSERRHRL